MDVAAWPIPWLLVEPENSVEGEKTETQTPLPLHTTSAPHPLGWEHKWPEHARQFGTAGKWHSSSVAPCWPVLMDGRYQVTDVGCPVLSPVGCGGHQPRFSIVPGTGGSHPEARKESTTLLRTETMRGTTLVLGVVSKSG